MGLVLKNCRNCKYCLPANYGKEFDKCTHRIAKSHNTEYADRVYINYCHGNYFELKNEYR